MKNFLLLFAIFQSFMSFGQPEWKHYLKEDTVKFTFELIYEVDSLSKTEIYVAAKAAIVKKLQSANESIQLDDSDNFHLFVKGDYKYLIDNKHVNGPYDLDFRVKDGRIRIFIDNLTIKTYSRKLGYYQQQVSQLCSSGEEFACVQAKLFSYDMINSIVEGLEKAQEDAKW